MLQSVGVPLGKLKFVKGTDYELSRLFIYMDYQISISVMKLCSTGKVVYDIQLSAIQIIYIHGIS
jgi:hypothetical protein